MVHGGELKFKATCVGRARPSSTTPSLGALARAQPTKIHRPPPHPSYPPQQARGAQCEGAPPRNVHGGTEVEVQHALAPSAGQEVRFVARRGEPPRPRRDGTRVAPGTFERASSRRRALPRPVVAQRREECMRDQDGRPSDARRALGDQVRARLSRLCRGPGVAKRLPRASQGALQASAVQDEPRAPHALEPHRLG